MILQAEEWWAGAAGFTPAVNDVDKTSLKIHGAALPRRRRVVQEVRVTDDAGLRSKHPPVAFQEFAHADAAKLPALDGTRLVGVAKSSLLMTLLTTCTEAVSQQVSKTAPFLLHLTNPWGMCGQTERGGRKPHQLASP